MAPKMLLLVLAASLALAAPHAYAVKAIDGFTPGLLTFYGGAPDGMDASAPSYGTKEGACGYGPIAKDAFPYFSAVGISPSNRIAQGSIDGCGQCLQIQCTDARAGACKTDSSGKPLSILAQVTDECPECGADHIDLQALSFAKIASPALGRVQMQFRRVECAVPGDLQVAVMNFEGGGKWLSITITDTGGRGAVKSVAVKGSNTASWQPMKNSWGAAWELGGAPVPPLDFQFMTDDGESVTAESVVKQNGGISGGMSSPVKFATGQQFTITDPASQQVTAFEGQGDPMLVTSSTPGNGDAAGASSSTSASASSKGGSASTSASASASASTTEAPSCNDAAPPGSFSCEQQKQFGKCGEAFMTQGNFCASTCGRCGGDPKQVKAFNGPGGRKLMAGAAGARLVRR